MLESILIGVVIAIAAIILLIIIVGGVKASKKKRVQIEETQAEQEKVVEATVEAPSQPMKVVIAQGETITVGSEGRIPCGEYTMESCDGEETFNVRIGRYVKEYENGTKVVLTEKQKVTPVSTSIILR